MFSYLLVIVIILLTTTWLWLQRRSNFWKSKNVPHLKPKPILGNYADLLLMKKDIGEVTSDILKKFPDEPYVGAYYGTEPALIIQSPELIKLVTTKDYYYFNSREIAKYTEKEPITRNLFFTYGDQWKVLRQNMSPLFSSAKMKNMFYLIEKCDLELEKLLLAESKNKAVEIRSLMARYTMACITSCVFGIDSKTMGDGTGYKTFRKMGDGVFGLTNIRALRIFTRSIWPSVFYGLGLKLFPAYLDKFFYDLLTGVFKARNYEVSSRNDFVDLFLGLKKNEYIVGDSMSNLKSDGGKKISIKVDDELLVTNAVLLFAAGFDTTANTASYTLFELAKDKRAQELVAEEVDQYLKKHKSLNYSCVTELPYLEACIDETLRLHPISNVLTREVTSDYTFPSGLQVSKGMRIHLPVQHLHRDPKYFPDPEEFRPERFLPGEKQNIQPYTYLPFGEGPRICIGMRFAKMELHASLITILKSYALELAPDMSEQVKLDPRGVVNTVPAQGIYLKLIPREKKLGV